MSATRRRRGGSRSRSPGRTAHGATGDVATASGGDAARGAAPRHVAVIVLGDVGRSPRMQYHTMSLADMSPTTQVSLVGYRGEACVPAVEDHPRIHKRLIGAPFAKLSRRWFLLVAPLKVLWQVAQLMMTLLFFMPRPDTILVQNPPSIPTLLVAWIAARLRGARFVIDWHNFGYTILALKLGERHALVRLSYAYEAWCARRADAHLCVTKAMRDWLAAQWGVRATVVYDCAPDFFRRCSPDECHDLFGRLSDQFPPAPAPGSSDAAGAVGAAGPEGAQEHTLMTVKAAPAGRQGKGKGKGKQGAAAEMRPDRPALIMSCTSWTPDEDFGILLRALEIVDARACAAAEADGGGASPAFPQLLVVVTGKGPERAMYEARFAELELRHVSIRTMWLEAADYPRLLGCADLGVSLHTSSSGLDLPMKVVDMFGCGLPVCAVGFGCLPELVQHGENGLVFSGSAQLADQIYSLFRDFPRDTARLDAMRRSIARSQATRWRENWNAAAAPLFLVPS